MTSSTNKNNKVIAQERTCERCAQPYPYISSMSDLELNEKYYSREEIEIDYSFMRSRGSKSGYHRKTNPSATNACYDCHNELLREQILIELKRQRNFTTIPNFEKAGMFACGQLPDDICWFCAARINVGPNHSSRNIYICEDCRAKGLSIDDVNKETRLTSN
jgi:hypothetical protein